MRKLILLLVLLNVACTTTGTYIPVSSDVSPKSQDCKVDKFMPGQQIKKDYDVVGVFSTQEEGLSVNCGWAQTVEKIRIKACSVGADAIAFIQVDTPSVESTCYRTKANLIRYKN